MYYQKWRFDEVMLVIQMCVGKHELQDVLLNEGFDVNITTNVLKKKLGLRKLQLIPFIVPIDGWPKEGAVD